MTPEEIAQRLIDLVEYAKINNGDKRDVIRAFVKAFEECKQEAYEYCEMICEEYTIRHLKDPMPAQGFRCNTSNDLRKAIRKLARGEG